MKDLDPKVREALASKRMIFTVTTGRSGTQYLTGLLQRVDGVAAFHEAHSRFSLIMRYAQEDPALARRFLIDWKLPEIASLKEAVYADTTHLFCKGFFEPMIDLGFVPDLILLRRDHRKVAESIFLLGEIPGDTVWYLSPDDPGVLRLPGWRDLHEYQRCFWYSLEIERRGEAYGNQARALGARVVEIGLPELATPGGFKRLLSELDLPQLSWWTKFKKAVRRPAVNQKERKKRLVNRHEALAGLDLDALEAGVRERITNGHS